MSSAGGSSGGGDGDGSTVPSLLEYAQLRGEGAAGTVELLDGADEKLMALLGLSSSTGGCLLYTSPSPRDRG